MGRIGQCVAVVATSAFVVTGCGTTDAPAAPTGFFPQVFSGRAFVTNAHLLKAAAVPGSTQRFTFHAVAPKSGGWALVVRCTRGTIRADSGGVISGGPCAGLNGMMAGCAGGLNQRLKVTVDQRQPSRWGIAIYRSTCRPPTAAEVRAKERGAPH